VHVQTIATKTYVAMQLQLSPGIHSLDWQCHGWQLQLQFLRIKECHGCNVAADAGCAVGASLLASATQRMFMYKAMLQVLPTCDQTDKLGTLDWAGGVRMTTMQLSLSHFAPLLQSL